MLRTPSPYKMVKVVGHTMSDAWWDMLGNVRTWYLTLACGHSAIRQSVDPPGRVRCSGCLRSEDPR